MDIILIFIICDVNIYNEGYFSLLKKEEKENTRKNEILFQKGYRKPQNEEHNRKEEQFYINTE